MNEIIQRGFQLTRLNFLVLNRIGRSHYAPPMRVIVQGEGGDHHLLWLPKIVAKFNVPTSSLGRSPMEVYA